MYRRGRIAAVLALALVTVLAGGVTGTMIHLRGNITTSPIRAGSEIDHDTRDSKDLNILLLGSDSRDLSENDFGSGDGSQRSDAMVLAHLSEDDGRIDAVQLPRDTLMSLPACTDTGHGPFSGGRGMLNSALNYGPACSVAAVEDLTGVPIDHFVELNFEGFMAIVDALGGLPVCLPDAMSDPYADLDLPAGQQTLEGKDALALARTRHAVGDGSDIARLGHQQMVMSAVVQEATSRQVVTRPDRLYSFLDATTSALTVDPGLSAITDMAALGNRVARVAPENITFMTMPWEPAPGDPNRVVPSAEAESVFAQLGADGPITRAGAQDEEPSPSDSDSGSASGSNSGSEEEPPPASGTTPPAQEESRPAPEAPPQDAQVETTTRTADTDLCSS